MAAYESLTGIHLDEMADKVGGRHRLTYLIAQRMRQINGGSPLLVEPREGEALLATVCREVEEGKVWLDLPEVTEAGEDIDFEMLGLDEPAPAPEAAT